MSIFSVILLISVGIFEYLSTGRQKRIKFEEETNNKTVKEVMLERIMFLKSHTKQLKIEENLERKIDSLENEIKGAGAITASMPYFWEIKSKEIQKIFDCFDTRFQVNRKRLKQKFTQFCIFTSIGVYLYFPLSLHNMSFYFSKLFFWAFFGMLTTLLIGVFFYFYATLYLFVLKKVSPLLIYVSWSSRFSTSYGITKLFIYGCIILSYFFYSNIYKYIYPASFPMFSGFVSHFISGIIIVTEIVAAIGGYLQVYEFAEKRIFKKEEL